MEERKETLTPAIELGGRVWPLRLTHNVMMLFSSATRVPLDQLENQLVRYDFLVLLLWLMLHESDGQLKREKFNAWLEEIGVLGVIKQVVAAVTEAVKAAVPQDEGTEQEADDQDPTAAKA